MWRNMSLILYKNWAGHYVSTSCLHRETENFILLSSLANTSHTAALHITTHTAPLLGTHHCANSNEQSHFDLLSILIFIAT